MNEAEKARQVFDLLNTYESLTKEATHNAAVYGRAIIKDGRCIAPDKIYKMPEGRFIRFIKWLFKWSNVK